MDSLTLMTYKRVMLYCRLIEKTKDANRAYALSSNAFDVINRNVPCIKGIRKISKYRNLKKFLSGKVYNALVVGGFKDSAETRTFNFNSARRYKQIWFPDFEICDEKRRCKIIYGVN